MGVRHHSWTALRKYFKVVNFLLRFTLRHILSMISWIRPHGYWKTKRQQRKRFSLLFILFSISSLCLLTSYRPSQCLPLKIDCRVDGMVSIVSSTPNMFMNSSCFIGWSLPRNHDCGRCTWLKESFSVHPSQKRPSCVWFNFLLHYSCNLIGSQQCNLFTNRTIFVLL